jgi:hypothetical protein
MIAVNASARTVNGRAISPSGLNDARITVIVGYEASRVTNASCYAKVAVPMRTSGPGESWRTLLQGRRPGRAIAQACSPLPWES